MVEILVIKHYHYFNQMRTAKLLLLLCILSIVGCTPLFEKDLKEETKKLEHIVHSIARQPLGAVHIEEFQNINDNHKRINALVHDFQLCSVYKHSFGISFRFKCEHLLERKSNYIDREYYLVKLLGPSEKTSLEDLERWGDCSAKPEELNNNWFYIRRHMQCD